VTLEAPEDLRDCVWLPANLQFTNGGETVALIPTRYPGSQASDDGLICLARKTVWSEIGPDRFAGLGQRVLATDTDEYDLMNVRAIELDEVPSGDGPAGDETA
jgi:type VI secretion system protein ImpE